MNRWWNPLTWTPIQAVLRAVTIVQSPTPALVDNGASFDGDYSRGPRERPISLMALAASHSTVWTVLSRRAANMAALPLKLQSGTGEEAVDVWDHPVLALLKNPSTTFTGLEMRRQLMVDLGSTGMAYLLKVRSLPGQPPISLQRLHPEKTRLVTSQKGAPIQAIAVNLDGLERYYSPDDVIIFRYPSWETGPWGLFGQGMVSALSTELVTDRKVKDFINRTAGHAPLDMLIQPDEEGAKWNKTDRLGVSRSYRGMARSGGPFVMSGRVKTTRLGGTPQDLQAREISEDIKTEIMSAGQVPPVIMGRETANFATARQQDAVYWTGIKHDAGLIDARLTVSLVAEYPDSQGLELKHDFSAILPLQGERTEQVKRAHLHIKAGATPAQAYAYEGLASAPVPDIPMTLPGGGEEEGGPPASEVPSPGVPGKATRAVQVRAVTSWSSWVRRYQGPSEVRLNRSSRRYLAAARGRYVKRVGAALRRAVQVQDVRRTANGWSIHPGGDGMVRAPVFDDGVDEEARALVKALGPAWRSAWVLALRGGVADLGLSEDLDLRVEFPEDVSRSLVGLLEDVSRTTAQTVQSVVEVGLAEGLSVGQIQEAIRQSVAFSPSRALRIARTEATRAVNAGTMEGYRQAQASGVALKKVWLTADDEAVRDSHQTMNGQLVDLDVAFLSGDGNEADHPGGFSVAEEDINCRCAVSAEVL